MEARRILMVVVAATTFVSAQSSPLGLGGGLPPTCACRLQYGGSNPCCCSELVVRPPPQARPPRAGPRLVLGALPGTQTFQPVGDACCCDQIAVSPAAAPRPHCDLCAAKALMRDDGVRTMGDEPRTARRPCPCGLPGCDCCSCGTPGCAGDCGPGCACRVAGCAPDCPCFCHSQPDECEGGSQRRQRPAPADPVSVSLAYSQMQRAKEHVREDALSFGFNQLPKDGPICSKPRLRAQEERLANWQAPVLELAAAAPGGGCRAALEEEARDALLRAEQRLLEDALEEREVASAAKPSLADLGYRPAAPRAPPLVPVLGCAGGVSSAALPGGVVPLGSFPMPTAYPEGRVVAVSFGDGDAGGRADCSDCDDDWSSECGEVGSAGRAGVFVPAATGCVGLGGVRRPYEGTPYSQVLGAPNPMPCASQLFNRIQAIAQSY